MIAATSVPAMLLGGAIPGFMVGFFLMLVIYIMPESGNIPAAERFPTLQELVPVCMGAIVPTLMPLIILGGMHRRDLYGN